MIGADFLVVGGGIAGLSAAARLAQHGRTIAIEAEDALGYHSSGRSATFSHYGIGNAAVRALTAHSRLFLEHPPRDFAPAPLARRANALFVATEAMLDALHALEEQMMRYSSGLSRVGIAEIQRLFLPLKTGADAVVAACFEPDGLRLDADALLQSCAKQVRARGGEVVTGCRIASIRHARGLWEAKAKDGRTWSAPILVNAAGAWADEIARMAGVRPLGLQPLRRTIIVLDPPPGMNVRGWPFVKSVVDDFYILPEAGRLIASPVDEIPAEPGDAQPEEYDVALAAWKVEQYTTLPVSRIAHRWAGLRSFTADRTPTAGFAPDAAGFFWLAGQGGYGLQTAPAMAEIAEALVTGADWPPALASLGVTPADILPGRLF